MRFIGRKLLQRMSSGQLKDIRENLKLRHLNVDPNQMDITKLPNETHPQVKSYSAPVLMNLVNVPKEFVKPPLDFDEIGRRMNLIRTEQMGNFASPRSYFLFDDLAKLETALILYSLEKLRKLKFQLLAVPDILSAQVINNCGMETHGFRNQVYKFLENGDSCLSGTSEMGIAGFFAGRTLEKNENIVAVSRCYRAEGSATHEEKGLYRVHQFTKVEMFSVCMPEASDIVLEKFRDIQSELFKDLGIHFKIIDMPPYELGRPAYRKYDIEAWMPGRKMWGEISSCSNCTDYQAKRLNVSIRTPENNIKVAHTVNGTACAVPRMLITILETFQNPNGTITVPQPLRRFMKSDKITPCKGVPRIKLQKDIPSDLRPNTFISLK